MVRNKPDKRIVYALKNCLKIKPAEKILIVTDNKKIKIARKFEAASRELAKNVDLILMKPTKQHGNEPENWVADAMKKFDVIIAITRYSITHTKAARDAAKTARVASLPNFIEEMYDSLFVDYDKIERISKKLAKIMDKGKNVHLTTPSGTKLNFSIEGHKGTVSCIFNSKKKIINLPTGESYTYPKNMNGTLIFDSYNKLIRKPTKLIIRKNRIIEFEKSQNGNIMKKILSADKNARYAAEFGIGTNYKARIIGNVLQDEKAVGTCHIAFGNNMSFGGRNKSSVHIDVMLFKPTIKVGNKIVMENGVPKWTKKF